MSRRLVPLLASLGLGLLLLAWALATLQLLFVEERDEALAALSAREASTRSYAQQTLAQQLQDALESARPRIEAAAQDPLQPGAGLLLVDAGRPRLPRRVAFAPGSETPADTLYRRVSARLELIYAGETRDEEQADPESDTESPWQARLELSDAFAAALRAGASDPVSKAFRAILSHRLRFRLGAERDLPSAAALLDFFERHGRPSRALMRQLLREGLSRSAREQLDGLQPDLLNERARFTRPDFELLAERVASLSERFEVRTDDFVARAAESDLGPGADRGVDLAALSLDTPALVGDWYVAPGPNERFYGIAVDVQQMLVRVRDHMTERELLEPEADVSLSTLARASLADWIPEPVEHLDLEIRAPGWESERTRIATRFRAKTGLALACAGFAVAIAVLTVIGQQRKRRMLELRAEAVAMLSHELRTPLASLRLQAETLQHRLADVPAASEYPRRILRDIDGLSFLVENILSFNRIERGAWQPERRAVSLGDLVRQMREELEAVDLSKLDVHAPGLDSVLLYVDPDWMRLLLLNLARNACQHNEQGRVCLRIEAEVAECVRVRFSDNGIGIPPEDWERVFEDFYRSTNARTSRGSGLGLAISRRILRMHQGKIRVLASSSGGTTFEITLPRRTMDEA